MNRNKLFNILRLSMVVLVVSLLNACASVKRGDPEFAPIMPPAVEVPQNHSGSIYQESTAWLLYEDMKARRVGDMLTVILEEQTDAKKKAETGISKSTNADGGIAMNATTSGKLGAASGDLGLNGNFSSDNEFDGKADSSQSNSLSGNITVVVVEVLSNGNMVVQGEKWTKINQGQEYVRLKGIVRQVDIHADNTIESIKVANAQFQYGGDSTLNNANRMGWLARFFINPLMIF